MKTEDEVSNELDFTGAGKDWHRGAVPAESARPGALADGAPIASALPSSATSNLSKTTVFQPDELSGLLGKGESAPVPGIATVAATGVPFRSGPVDPITPAGSEAANVVAVIEWPSGGTTEFSARLNIGRDPRFCPCAAEMTSEPQVSRRHAVLDVCAGGVVVRDLDSRNGTFVNDEKVPSGGALLVERDAQIRFGPRSSVRLTLKRTGCSVGWLSKGCQA
jgi:hypothetical protein